MRPIYVDTKGMVFGLLIGLRAVLLMGFAGDDGVRYQIASPQSDHFYVIDV